MADSTPSAERGNALRPYLSALAAWSLAVGTSIGWGSLVVTNNEYLSNAGPVGSVLGLVLGALIMLVIARNYAYMVNSHPESGGVYAYVKTVFGYDRAFLVSWFVSLTYMAMLWANATSMPLFARYFLGDTFRVGYLYTILGYDVYAGEIALTLAVLGVFGLVCMKSRRLSSALIVGCVLTFCAGIAICLVGGLVGSGASPATFSPGFVPDAGALRQVVGIAFITPWAFVGFESVSHAAEEYRFPAERILRILRLAIGVTAALYAAILLLSVTAYPPTYASWLEYIRDLGNLSGIEGLPAFYVARAYLGDAGVLILMLSLLGLVFSSLIGNILSLSRLFHAVAADGIMPERFASVSGRGIPEEAVKLILLLCLPIPLLGRTPIGWIVDVTTIGATLLYGFVSAATLRQSRHDGARATTATGALGLALMVVFGLYPFFAYFLGGGGIARETQLVIVFWSVLGLFYFRRVMIKDHERRFGNNLTVWIVLVAFIFILTMLCICEECAEVTAANLVGVRNRYASGAAISSVGEDPALASYQTNLMKMIVFAAAGVVGIFVVSLATMLSNWAYVRRREEETARHLGTVRDIAYKDPLTGGKNKHAYLLAEREFDVAIAQGQAHDIAVVVCDVNGLKMINDTQGHKAGDEYIRQAFQMVCDIFQHSPVYRIGGDEFVITLTGRDFVIRKELVLALHDRSVEHISSGGVVVSGGLSDYQPGEDRSLHDVFQRADDLMYEEKQLLKALGAVTREDAENLSKPSLPTINGEEVLSVKRFVLVVDDEDVNLMLLGKMLQGPFDLLYASDGFEALEQVKAHAEELALVLLDLQMPRVSGMEVLQVMHEEQALRHIPVIVMTADQSAEVECLKLGALDFIPKPYPTQEVVQARVNRCIELSEKRDIIESTERDALTNLYTLNHFKNYVRMYDRHYTELPMDAVVLDVTHFHMVNELYGKQYGDAVRGGRRGLPPERRRLLPVLPAPRRLRRAARQGVGGPGRRRRVRRPRPPAHGRVPRGGQGHRDRAALRLREDRREHREGRLPRGHRHLRHRDAHGRAVPRAPDGGLQAVARGRLLHGALPAQV